MANGTTDAKHGIIPGVLLILDAVEDAGDEAPGTSPSHLRALLREALGRNDLPEDKIWRWIGFAKGVMAARGLPVHCEPLPCVTPPSATADDPLADATKSVMRGLAPMLVGSNDTGNDIPGTSLGHLRSLLSESMASALPVDELSARLGFVQGVMAVRGLISVAGERKRTRPIFHAAYELLGRAKPPTVAVS